jgi:hypothetical protein
MTQRARQAIVIVHGMGEQKPLDQLRRFVDTALPPVDGERVYVSRPDKVTDSYEARRYLAPRQTHGGEEVYAQTELYELHWAHLMQGNRVDDLWPTFRRVLIQAPWKVPTGLRIVWLIFWVLIVLAVWAVIVRFDQITLTELDVPQILGLLLGTSALAAALTYALTQFVPKWLKTSLVDVVRYLDTSPRSYDVRRKIRKEAVSLLEGLHESGRYQRIMIVAHSLGAFIAYDAIAYYWSRVNKLHAGFLVQKPTEPEAPAGLEALEAAADAIDDASDEERPVSAEMVEAYRIAQRDLWVGMRLQGNPWLVTDFISVGTPMYFADQIATIGKARFEDSVEKREMPVCPPRPNPTLNRPPTDQTRFSWVNKGRRTLYHAAPFAVVRWTNMWFPARAWFFGDWFGGALAPLFGRGIVDIALSGNDWKRFLPGIAHTRYFKYGNSRRSPEAANQIEADEDEAPDLKRSGDIAFHIEEALDLASTSWVAPTLAAPKYSETTK